MFEWRHIKLLMRELWYNLQDKGIWESYDQQNRFYFDWAHQGAPLFNTPPNTPFVTLGVIIPTPTRSCVVLKWTIHCSNMLVGISNNFGYKYSVNLALILQCMFMLPISHFFNFPPFGGLQCFHCKISIIIPNWTILHRNVANRYENRFTSTNLTRELFYHGKRNELDTLNRLSTFIGGKIGIFSASSPVS